MRGGGGHGFAGAGVGVGGGPAARQQERRRTRMRTRQTGASRAAEANLLHLRWFGPTAPPPPLVFGSGSVITSLTDTGFEADSRAVHQDPSELRKDPVDFPSIATLFSKPSASVTPLQPERHGWGVWHKASVSDCLPLAAPIGLSPLLVLTLCGSERVLVVSTEPLDDLSCLTTPGSAVPETGCCPSPGGGCRGDSACPRTPTTPARPLPRGPPANS